MKQDSSITKAMTAAQETHAADIRTPRPTQAVVYRLYTEEYGNLRDLTLRYFDGFTFFPTIGYYQGIREVGMVIEIIGTSDDLQKVVHLAGDIREVNNQTSVLVTWGAVNLLNVNAHV